MKLKVRKISLIAICILSAFINCTAQDITSFYFEEPQPRKEETISRFPAAFRGLYKNDKDSTRRLRITGDTVAFEIPVIQYATADALLAKNYIVKDSVVINPLGKQLISLIRNDTVYFVDYIQSVFFVINQQNVVKKAGDVIVLSKQVETDKWECMLLYKENDVLCIAYFDADKKLTDIEDNKKIDLVQSKPYNYYITSLKKKDFIKLIDKNYFPEKQYFHKRYNWQ